MVDVLQELTRLQPDSIKESFVMIFGNKVRILISDKALLSQDIGKNPW